MFFPRCLHRFHLILPVCAALYRFYLFFPLCAALTPPVHEVNWGGSAEKRSVGSILLLLAFTAIPVVCGCSGGKKPVGFPDVFPCSVAVMQENEPCANAMVIFFTDNEALARWSIGGQTDENGVAVMATEGKYPGAPVGQFKVLVTKQETERKEITRPNATETEYRIGKSWSYIPLEFSDRAKTKLTATVVKGKNEIKLDLGKKVKIKVDGM